MDIAVVVPTNRPAMLREFIEAWAPQLLGRAALIVMEDAVSPTPFLIDNESWLHHYAHNDVARELGDDRWIIPRGSSACRSFGTLMALELGADIVWHLDDDCRPEAGVPYLWRLRKQLTATVPDPAWWNTLHRHNHGSVRPRGYPYGIREHEWPVMIHHGLWSHVPDLDGRTQLAMPDLRLWPSYEVDVVPCGAFFPMCGMNLAFRREAAPLMYMGLQGGGWPYDRFDDMWAGLFAKKIADHLGWAVTSGAPSVRHDRASDAARNAEIEAPGIEAHELLWPHIAEAPLDRRPVSAAHGYRQMAEAVAWFNPDDYWPKLAAAMDIWADLTTKALG